MFCSPLDLHSGNSCGGSLAYVPRLRGRARMPFKATSEGCNPGSPPQNLASKDLSIRAAASVHMQRCRENKPQARALLSKAFGYTLRRRRSTVHLRANTSAATDEIPIWTCCHIYSSPFSRRPLEDIERMTPRKDWSIWCDLYFMLLFLRTSFRRIARSVRVKHVRLRGVSVVPDPGWTRRAGRR